MPITTKLLASTACIAALACAPCQAHAQDAFRFTALNSVEHLREYRPPRGLGTMGLFVCADDRNIRIATESPLNFVKLRINGEDLTVVSFGRFSTIGKIFHTSVVIHSI